VLACWCYNGVWKACWGDEFDQHELLADIADADFIVCHQSKYELGWLARCGLDLRSVLVYDTMLADWVIGGNRWSNLKQLAMDKCLARYGLALKDPTGRFIKAGVDVRDVPRAWLEDYCFEDVRSCVDLHRVQTEILERDGLLHIQYARCLLTPALVAMEAQGLCLDKERVEREYTETLAAFNERKREMDEMTGGINFRSRPQLGTFLYDMLGFEELRNRGEPDRTPAGARKTDVTTLDKLVAKNKKQRKFKALLAELTTLNTALTKALNFFKGVCDLQDGVFYGVLNQGTTANHRLSSSGKPVFLPQPNGKTKKASAQLQNIDRDYKRLFRAKHDGWFVIEADGGSLEFRAAAELSQDPVAIYDIVNGTDVHNFTSETLTAAGQETDRQGAKPHTFKPLYGGNSGTDAEVTYYQAFRDKYHVINETQRDWTLDVLRDKELVTPYGMRFYWPDTMMTRSGYITNTPSIFNYPVSNFATGEIIPIALVWLWHMTAGWESQIVLTVHDSAVLEVPPDEVEPLKPVLADCFTVRVYETLEKLYNYRFRSVPLAVGIKVGEHWSEGKEVTATVMPDDGSNVVWKAKS
jgi:DNA polymerase I-like protein with 3'-5' exonuclease and polymerase domains